MKFIAKEINHSNFIEEEHPRAKDGKFATKEERGESNSNEKVQNIQKNKKKTMTIIAGTIGALSVAAAVTAIIAKKRGKTKTLRIGMNKPISERVTPEMMVPALRHSFDNIESSSEYITSLLQN